MHDLVVGHWFLMPWESGLVRHGWCVLESWVVVDASDEMGKKKDHGQAKPLWIGWFLA